MPHTPQRAAQRHPAMPAPAGHSARPRTALDPLSIDSHVPLFTSERP